MPNSKKYLESARHVGLAQMVAGKWGLAAALLFSGVLSGCGGAEDVLPEQSAGSAAEDLTFSSPECGHGVLRVTGYAVEFTSSIPQKLQRIVRIGVKNPGPDRICHHKGTIGLRRSNGEHSVIPIAATDFLRGNSEITSVTLPRGFDVPIDANVCFGLDETCLAKHIPSPIGE